MTPLRQHMIDAMLMRGFSERTRASYLAAVKDLAHFARCSPDTISLDTVQQWLLYLLKERKLSSSSCRLQFNGVHFLFKQVLKREDFGTYGFTLPKLQQKIPELLNPQEVARILAAPQHDYQRTMLALCYGCGLRVSELVRVKVRDIDGERSLLHVTQGKGGKDRLVPIGTTLLGLLRAHWVKYHPSGYLFRGQQKDRHLCTSTPQKLYQFSRKTARIRKKGGIHSLRHAYATHSLNLGVPVHQLQKQLGHRDIHTTMHYAHWLPESGEGGVMVDLIAQLPALNHG